MKNTGTIALRELTSYTTSPMAYVVGAVFLALTGIFFGYSSATYSSTSVSGYLGPGSLVLLLLGAMLTMRLIAEERKMGTLELLLTAPVRDSEVIIGKFLGSLGLLTALIALTLYYPLLLSIFGDPDWGPISAGYLGLFLLGCAALSIGLFASTLTSNQIVAAVVSGGILFALWFVGQAASFLPKDLGNTVAYFSLSKYYPDFTSGMIDTRGVVYYLSVTVLFLFLGIRSLENSRWN
ncbi:MAG: ABC transporter permease subunit [Chloroflexi bacterium]|nr:ABC transporter permease subunit [Chloroflexota bacterium]